MARRDETDRRAWVNYVGLAILALCYAVALLRVFSTRREEMTHDVIRLTHWQLELGVRDGIQELIRRFEQYKARAGHPVKVIQIPVTERAYQQYITTQMVGGTAPDLVELGFFPQEFFGRYFLTMSRVLQEPNPFIREQLREWEQRADLTDTERRFRDVYRDLRDRSWMDTFTDGLRNLYNQDLQEYFGVGFSQFTVRMFYNKTLFREVLNREDPPRTYRELLDVCARLAAHAAARGRDLIPIASSGYQVSIFRGRYTASLTADVAQTFDLDLDGWTQPEETLAAILRGEWTPENAQYRGALEMVNRLARYFPPGFMSLGRMDAGFAFVQGRAAMITSGSWDARSFLKQIADQPPGRRFDVGIFDFPLAGRDDPEFGPHFDGQSSEAATGTGFSFGITRYARHEDLCIEFLQFCTTPEANTILNRHAEWIPAVRGAEATDMLKRFEPNYVGYWGGAGFDTGPRGRVLAEQLYWPLVSGETDYATYARQLMQQLPPAAALDYSRLYKEQAETLPGRHARRSVYLALLAWGDPATRADSALKLLRSWDALAPAVCAQGRLDAILRNTEQIVRERRLTSAFNTAFFEQLAREMGP
jgi:raffinose/stachyose/melibiose transport system substrate-binding protein